MIALIASSIYLNTRRVDWTIEYLFKKEANRSERCLIELTLDAEASNSADFELRESTARARSPNWILKAEIKLSG